MTQTTEGVSNLPSNY